ncbi:MAG: hypothetical protein MJY56_06350 [Bacteroidales bacterium]|nr:hypothetical protein [Bacteroidales bacterium]
MSKKSIIVLSILLSVMALVAGFMVYVLYNGLPDFSGLTPEEKAARAEMKAAMRREAELEKAEAALQEASRPSEEPALEPVEEAVELPEGSDGPFEVKNCATGKMNSLLLSDGNLTLTETATDALLWSRPFTGHLAGKAVTVDYFANGKLQFLFISGNSLHLYDRLGREVEGFPVTLKKTVFLGPAIYDFAGQRRYNIMVLNRDNTVDMYNLKGEVPSSWKGIAPKEKILGLPDYREVAGRSYWILHTETNTQVYGFYAGEPLKVLDGNVEADKINLNL